MSRRSALRAALFAGLAGFGLTGLGAPQAAAQPALTRIAFSQRLGVEIFADATPWCGPTPVLRVVADQASAFETPELAALLQRVGTSLIARDCPSAQGVTFVGAGKASPTTVLWHATAAAAAGWVVRPEIREAAKPQPPAGSDLDAVTPRPVAAVAPPVVVAPAVVSLPAASPLIGDWAADYPNPRDATGRTFSLSIDRVEPGRLEAVVQITAPTNTGSRFNGAVRLLMRGVYDAASGQFQLTPGIELHANGIETWNRDVFDAVFDPSTQTVQVEGQYNGGRYVLRLTRTAATPKLATDARAALAERDRRTGPARAALPQRPVGNLAQGQFQMPTCAALLEWAASQPLELRIRMVPGRNGMLRHYTDEATQRVFGAPAYAWVSHYNDIPTLPPGGPRPWDVLNKACNNIQQVQRDPRWDMLRKVMGDDESLAELSFRRRTDAWVVRAPLLRAFAGGPAEEAFDDLAPLMTEDTARQAYAAAGNGNRSDLLPADLAAVAAASTRLRAEFAARGAAEATQAIASTTADPDGLAQGAARRDRFAQSFPGADTAALDAALSERRQAAAPAILQSALQRIGALSPALDQIASAQSIAAQANATLVAPSAETTAALNQSVLEFRDRTRNAALDSALAEIAGAPVTAEGIPAARRIAAGWKEKLATELSATEMTAAADQIDAALASFGARARDRVLADAQAAIAATPPTADGARALAARRLAIAATIGTPPPVAFAGYDAAVTARLAEIAAAARPALDAALRALAVDWASVPLARRLASEAAAPFADTKAALDMRKAGEDRARAILAGLADAAVAELAVRDAKPGMERVFAPMHRAAEAAQPFAADPAGRDQAARIAKAAADLSRSRAADDLPAYKAQLDRLPPTREAALQLARAAYALQYMVEPRFPGIATAWLDPTVKAAFRAQDGACDAAVREAGMSSSDAARPMVVGRDVETLGSLVCRLRASGIRAGRLDKPGFFASAKDEVLTLYLPDGLQENAARNAIEQMAGALLMTPRGLQRRPSSQDDVDPFDFTRLMDAAAAPVPQTATVQKLWLRQVEARPALQALVGVQVGDDAKQVPLSIKEWEQWSAQAMALGAVAPFDRALCGRDRGTLDMAVAAQAMLACKRS